MRAADGPGLVEAPGAPQPYVELFFSYAHEDEPYRERLEKHLTTLRNEGLVSDWHDRMIDAGDDWDETIRRQLKRADIILLLLSADFLASDYCTGVEMREALERHRAGSARVIPVVVQPCDWRSTELGALHALPRDAEPITTWPNEEEAYLDVARGIRVVATAIRARRDAGRERPSAARKRVTVAAVELAVLDEVDEAELVGPALEYASRTLADLFAAHGGTVSPSRPDELTSVFGIPRLAEDDTLRAVRAACEVHLVLPALNEELERRFGVTLAARVGVDAGTVVVDEAHARSIASSAAARGATSLTRLARAGETLVGERAYALVRHAVRVEPREPEADGEPPLRRLIGVLPNVRARPLRPRSPLVGRQWETESLAKTFERVAAERTCRLCTLVGPPGIGKSRVAQEFARSVASRSVVLRGVCVESAPTYSPLLEVVRQAAAVDPTDSPERVLEKIAALLGGEDDADAVAPALAGLFDIAELPVDVESRSRDVRLLLEAVAAEVPLVVVFDDIHLAKPAFLELLGSIAEQSFGAPLLMLCLAWPDLDDRHPHWSENIPNATRIRLEPLDDPDSGALIENLLGAEAVDVLRDRVTEAADGNPLFVEELIAMLVDRALIEPRDGVWVPTGELPRDFPATVEAVVATRLDALSDDERAIVRAAAVEGMHFHVGAVAVLTAEELDGTVSSALAALARKDLVRRDRAELPGEDAFRFRHVVIRDVAYESVPRTRRPELHERFGTWVESKVGDRIAEYEETIAFHLEQAFELGSDLRRPPETLRPLRTRAGRLLFSAGRRAIARGDMADAVSLLTRAFALLPEDDEERAALMLDLAVALMETGKLERALELYDAAADAARAAGDIRVEWYARIQASGVRADRDPDLGLRALTTEADEAQRVFTALGDELGLAKVWRRRGFVGIVRCRWRAAQEAFQRARRHARRAGADRDEAVASSMLFFCLVLGPTHVDSAIRRGEKILGEGRFRGVGGFGLAALGSLHAMRGSFDEARSLVDQSRVILEDLGQTRRLVEASLFDGTASLLAGDAQSAAERLRSAHDVAREAGQPGLAASIGVLCAEALYALDRHDEADAMAVSIGGAAAHDDVFTQIKWRALHGKELARRGETDAALAHARDAVARAETTDDLNSRAAALADLSFVLRADGRVEQAQRARDDAVALYRKKGNVVAEHALHDGEGRNE